MNHHRGTEKTEIGSKTKRQIDGETEKRRGGRMKWSGVGDRDSYSEI